MKKLGIVAISFFLLACSTSTPKQVAPVSMPVATANANAQTPVAMLPHSADVNEFIQKMVVQYHFDGGSLSALLSQANIVNSLVTQMNHPNEKRLSWYQYQKLFVSAKAIQGGQAFLKQNQKVLHLAERRYGVPPGIIVGILGVETRYGLNEGHVSALDALYTLSFDYPRRETYFQNELAQFLILTRDANFDPLEVKSSYAGALGMPQFMPSAYRQYAVSSGHHYPDLFSNSEDAILSVGNYLAKMGWQRGMPVALQAIDLHDQPIPDSLVNQTLSLKAFAKAGVVAVNLPHTRSALSMQAKLLKLQGADGPEYWFAFSNFNVIKRYNASDLYAMSVWSMSQFVIND